MKNTLLIILLLSLQNYCSAQKIENNNNDTIRFGKPSSPIYVLNGKRISTVLFEKEYSYGKKKKISAIVIEGDSTYMKSIGNKESILKKYFGDETKRGILLFFTSKMATTLSGRSMRAFIKKNNYPTLWSMTGLSYPLTSDSSIINSVGIKNITRIQVIKNIGFQNKDGSYDFFNIVIVVIKKDVLLDFYLKED